MSWRAWNPSKMLNSVEEEIGDDTDDDDDNDDDNVDNDNDGYDGLVTSQ